MPEHDVAIAENRAELEREEAFVQNLLEGARGRDLNATEQELMEKKTNRMAQVKDQLAKLVEFQKISLESRERIGEIAKAQNISRQGVPQTPIEYRSAAQYIADRYQAFMGDDGANQRLELYHRAAAHQTTADNPGLLPETIVGPVVNFVDTARPIVAVLGPQDLGTGSWAYARVTQHTQVGLQSAEKAELPSRKMTITKTPLSAPTYGGYVNVSRQDINRTSPQILDMVINDLAGQYAIQTEAAAAAALTAAAQTGPVIPVTPTAGNIATAIWGAAGSVITATKGQGRVVVAVSADQLGIIGPIFPPINPTNAYSPGFSIADIQSGVVGSVSGLTVILSAGLATDTILVFSTAAARAFEARYGALQVVEPSVWGVQVGYAGDFQTVVIEPTAIVRVTTA